ncbi:MAG: DNA-binding CsgD family transcriptional regulator [Zhongshania marina]|jgi:DNA-binding CsgD family transcriptional regulator
MVDMKVKPKIVIWSGCDDDVARAIDAFCSRWGPYSQASRRYPIGRLLEEEVDHAVGGLGTKFPLEYLSYFPGLSTGTPLSRIIKVVGFEASVHVQKELLRRFLKFADLESETDNRFIATLETLIELVWACACKRPTSSRPPEGGSRINAQRFNNFCRFCGNPAELKAFLEEGYWPLDDVDFGSGIRLSDKYCADHRPKCVDGSWNPCYRKALRSSKQFDLELERLQRQCIRPAHSAGKSGNKAVDLYIQSDIAYRALQPADESQLRTLARLIVDGGLSDRKKEIIALLLKGRTQSEIAEQLSVSRQAISKALASIPSAFRLDALR